MSCSLWPHEPQHARPPCTSPTPGVQPNPCPLSQWCHPTISSSVVPFSSYPQSSPASQSFQMSQLFASGGQSIGVSASTYSFLNSRRLSHCPGLTQAWSHDERQTLWAWGSNTCGDACGLSQADRPSAQPQEPPHGPARHSPAVGKSQKHHSTQHLAQRRGSHMPFLSLC